MRLSEYVNEAVAKRKSGKYGVHDPFNGGLTYDKLLAFIENNRDFKPSWSWAGKALSRDMENIPLSDIYLTFKHYEGVPNEQSYMYGKVSKGNRYIMVSGAIDSIGNLGDIPVMYIEFDNNDVPFFFTLRFYEPGGGFDFYQQGQASDMKRMEKNLRKIIDV